jgi:hypothetical protein
MRDVLARTKWGEGDAAPAVVTVEGKPYWVVARGMLDLASHADVRGRPVGRHCVQLYAAEAVPDGGAFLTPHPYTLGLWLNFELRAAECRMPGTRNYSS